ncbi:MAG: hypothetical protein AB7O39_03305 [Flavobacteriaceae bacterium]
MVDLPNIDVKALVQYHAGRIKRIKTEKGSVDATLASFYSAAVNDGVDKDALKWAIKVAADKDAKKHIQSLRNRMRYLQMLGVDEVAQLDIEDFIVAREAAEGLPDTERASERGLRDGRMQADRDNPYSEGSPQYRAYEDSYRTGTEEAKRIEQMRAEAESDDGEFEDELIEGHDDEAGHQEAAE